MQTNFLVCGAPRTGTNWFLTLLYSTGLFGILDECFGKRVLTRYLEGVDYDERMTLSDQQVSDIFERIVSDTKKDGVWGSKMFLDQLNLFLRCMEITGFDWTDVKVIWIRRRNMVKQAISFAKASAMQNFAVKSESELKEYIENTKHLQMKMWEIEGYYKHFSVWDYTWQYFFESYGINPHVIYYEDMENESDLSGIIQDVLNFLDLCYNLPLNVTSGHYPQYTDWNKQAYDEFMRRTLVKNGIHDLMPTTNILGKRVEQ